MNELKLELFSVTKQVEKKISLDGVTFDVSAGELMVLVGPADSGKTTLLRVLSGLDVPDEGSIFLNREEITLLKANQRNIGAVFYKHAYIYPSWNVYENIAFGLRTQHLTTSGIEMRVLSAAHVLELNSLLKNKVSVLTDEEQWSVALARALAKKASLYLFDEIPSHFNTRSRLRARQDMLKVHRAGYQPTIYATSDPIEALAIAHRIAVLHKGQLQQVGTREELIQTPANTFVAQWMTAPPMNLVPVYLQSVIHVQELRFRVLSGSFSALLPAHWNKLFQQYSYPSVILGIRPEGVYPDWAITDLSSAHLSMVRAEVMSWERYAKSALVTLRIDTQIEIRVMFYPPGIDFLQYGQLITVGIDTTQICLFHTSTGALLRP